MVKYRGKEKTNANSPKIKDIFFLPNANTKYLPELSSISSVSEDNSHISQKLFCYNLEKNVVLLSHNRAMHVSILKSTDLNNFEMLTIDFWRHSIILENTEDTNTKFACSFLVQHYQLLKLLVFSRNNPMLWLQCVPCRQIFRKFGLNSVH